MINLLTKFSDLNFCPLLLLVPLLRNLLKLRLVLLLLLIGYVLGELLALAGIELPVCLLGILFIFIFSSVRSLPRLELSIGFEIRRLGVKLLTSDFEFGVVFLPSFMFLLFILFEAVKPLELGKL